MASNISLIRWAGGKGRQLNDLLPFIPNGRVYVEPFGGGASVLLNRPRSEIEGYNDLDSSLVGLFSVVRDDALFTRFSEYLRWTPYSREIFEDALGHEDESDAVISAAKFYTVLNQGISGKRLASKGDWARARSDNLANRWDQRKDKLEWIHDRLRHVQIECRDALDILQEWDGADTVFYCDPPYVLETRSKKRYYAVEPGDSYHEELVDTIIATKGRVVLSGYLHPIYERLADYGWTADSYGAQALMTVHGKGGERDSRREVVWRNPQCVESGLLVPLPFPEAGYDNFCGDEANEYEISENQESSCLSGMDEYLVE